MAYREGDEFILKDGDTVQLDGVSARVSDDGSTLVNLDIHDAERSFLGRGGRHLATGCSDVKMAGWPLN
ncbi:MAG: hypothetical protein ABFE08_16305 [Armatimonadia bacterium]